MRPFGSRLQCEETQVTIFCNTHTHAHKHITHAHTHAYTCTYTHAYNTDTYLQMCAYHSRTTPLTKWSRGQFPNTRIRMVINAIMHMWYLWLIKLRPSDIYLKAVNTCGSSKGGEGGNKNWQTVPSGYSSIIVLKGSIILIQLPCICFCCNSSLATTPLVRKLLNLH